MAYYISNSECTADHPSPGYYYTVEDEDGNETVVGPFHSKAEALDDKTGGAYSEHLYQQQRDREIDYGDAMRDAGRGHLLGEDF